MPRVKRGTKRRESRKKTLALAKGFFLTKSKLHRAAQEAVEKSLKYGYVGRKLKKRDFRALWIVRIGAGARLSDLSYSRFMDGMKKAGIDLNRKILADLAYNDPPAFAALATQAKAALEAASTERGIDFSGVTVELPNLGKRCSGPQYHELFKQAFQEIGEVDTAADARAKFWENWKRLSTGYHVGKAGIEKYSAPFLSAIDAAAK